MASDRRITVRLSPEELVEVERACRVAGVPLGAMARVCTLNWCAYVAAELAVGRDFGFRRRSSERVRAVTSQVERQAMVAAGDGVSLHLRRAAAIRRGEDPGQVKK